MTKKKSYVEAFAELRNLAGGAYDDIDDVVGYVNALRQGKDNAQQSVYLTQEQEAVLSAIAQVCAMTGFGRVTVEIRDGKVRLVEISATVLVKGIREVKSKEA